MKRKATVLVLPLLVSCSSHGEPPSSSSYGQALTTVLVGDATTYSTTDATAAGIAEAWRYTSARSGVLNSLSLCVAPSNGSKKIDVGLYASNLRGTRPTTLLTSGTISSPVPGWNSVSVPSTNVVSGATYWLAIVSPTGEGTATFCALGNTSQYGSRDTGTSNLTGLPATYPRKGTTYLGWSAGINGSNVSNGGAGGAGGQGGASGVSS